MSSCSQHLVCALVAPALQTYGDDVAWQGACAGHFQMPEVIPSTSISASAFFQNDSGRARTRSALVTNSAWLEGSPMNSGSSPNHSCVQELVRWGAVTALQYVVCRGYLIYSIQLHLCTHLKI
jgi:hypothetical protein